MTERGKGFKEAFARFFEEPTREGLRELLRDGMGEANELDFKRKWPEGSKLAKHVLGLANFGGGCIVVGMEQVEDGTLDPVGLPALTDKTAILSGLDNYLPDTLMRSVEVLDFSFRESEYPKLKGKSFQVLFVEDNPAHMPFLSIKDGASVSSNTVYTRRGTATEPVNQEELQIIMSRRVETGYSSRRELDLQTHLQQLRVLYEQLSPFSTKTNPAFQAAISRALKPYSQFYGKRVPNPNYPTEDYEGFVAGAIVRKKRRIELELDIEDIPSPKSP